MLLLHVHTMITYMDTYISHIQVQHRMKMSVQATAATAESTILLQQLSIYIMAMFFYDGRPRWSGFALPARAATTVARKHNKFNSLYWSLGASY